jgi:HrpA-like RNA helicase
MQPERYSRRNTHKRPYYDTGGRHGNAQYGAGYYGNDRQGGYSGYYEDREASDRPERGGGFRGRSSYRSGHGFTEYKPKKRSAEEEAKAAGLPIGRKKKEIVENIGKEQVVIISGETGCGKSTQVPQYIYEECQRNKQTCRMICTQPRRLAAINLAKRVAYEMGCRLGGLVGYQVGLNPMFGEETAILFVTTGIFLQRLIHEQSLAKYTHVILDEVHERDLNNDFSMVAIKYLLQDAPKVKIILMSATFDTKLFSLYFSPASIRNISESVRYKTEPRPVAARHEPSGWSDDEDSKAGAPRVVEQWNVEVRHEEEDTQVRINEMEKIAQGAVAPVVSIDEHKYKIDYYYLEELYRFADLGKQQGIQ